MPLHALSFAQYFGQFPLAQAAEDLPWYMPAAAAIFLTAGVLMLIGTLRRTLMVSKVQLEEDVRKWQAQADFWRTMDSAVAQLGESVDVISKQLAEREATLDRLTKEASASIAKLDKLIEEAKVAASLPPAKSTRRVKPPTESQSSTGQTPTENIEQDLDREDDEGTSGRVVHMEQVRDQIARRHRRVYEMFDIGHTVLDISKDTGLNIGEIELILAIRQRGVGG